MPKFYIEHEGKAVNSGGNFKHVMAITLDPRTNFKEGIIRCIKSREGNVAVKGFVDRSELHTLKVSSPEHFKIGDRLIIKNEEEILKKLTPEGFECIGLEDPDIWIDEKNNLTHLYFTIPLKPSKEARDAGERTKINLGHAVGKDLDSLEMTLPVLLDTYDMSAKEVSIAPLNKKGFRYNLIESRDRQPDFNYSTVQVAIAKDMNGPWQHGDIVFHPKKENISWIAGHASPGPLFSKNFIDLGEGKMLGVINGREADKIVNGETTYGIFSVGLFIYDYENGKILWVTPEPFIRDSEARTITFASQVVETGRGEAILYAHVDDSFVRAYTLKAELLKPLLPDVL